MNKEKLKSRLFKIIPLKESLDRNEISEENIKSYINSQYVYFKGYEAISNNVLKEDISYCLKGLEQTIVELKKEQVKKIIFKIINEIDRRC